MRVLHINTERTWRGGERQTLLTVQEQRRQGVDSRLACRRSSLLEAEAVAADVPTIPLRSSPASMLAGLARIAGDFDLLHSHSGRGHSLATLAVLARRKPIVVTRRVDFVPRHSRFNRLKYGHAARVVCVSRFIADQLLEWGIPADRLTVIHDAVPDEAFPPRDACLRELRALTGIPPEQVIVGNIAALVPHKDQATLLRAAHAVVAERDDVAFVVIGTGELDGELRRLRAELGLERHVHLTGYVPGAQKLLPAFDVFAMSSQGEGLGSIVLDAGLAGVPVAATSAGGLPEIVIHEQTGLLVPVRDSAALAGAILRLLADRELGRRLADAAGRRARAEFSPAEMARRYVEVYTEVLNSGA